MTPRLAVTYDPANGVVRSVGEGVWTAPILARYLLDLRAAVARARAADAPIRALSDMSKAGVQPGAIASEIEAITGELFHPGDRVAIIVGSSLVKLQMRRVVHRATVEIFLLPGAAETWLNAHARPASG